MAVCMGCSHPVWHHRLALETCVTICTGVPTLSGTLPSSGGPCDQLYGRSHPIWHHRLPLEASVTVCMGVPTLSGIITWMWRPV